MQSITCTHAHMLACNLKIKGSEREKPRQDDREKQQQKYYTEANSMSRAEPAEKMETRTSASLGDTQSTRL